MGKDINNSIISIIVPIYNVEDYLKECIDSILRQTFKNIEIILVNDGSTDRSYEICKTFRDDRIILINKKNGGLSDARNKGVEASSGEYIVFVDSDDVIHHQLIEELAHNLFRYNADISGCNLVKFHDGETVNWACDNPEIQQWNSEEIMAHLVGEYSHELTVACCKMYHRSVILSHPFPSGKIHEDEFTSYKILGSCKSFIYSPKKLYGYRQRKNSIMSTYNLKSEIDKIEAKSALFVYYKTNVIDRHSIARAFFLLMRNIELSYYIIYSVNRHSEFLEELIEDFSDYYIKNIDIIKNLNIYERSILFIFYKSKFLYRLIEKVKKGLF